MRRTIDLLRDERGVAGLAIAFVGIGVVALTTLSVIFFMAVTTSQAREGVMQLSSNTRTAVVYMEAELTAKGAAQVIAEMTAAGAGYVPAAAIDLAPSDVAFQSAVLSGTDVHLTMRIDSDRNAGDARTVTVVFHSETYVANGEDWVLASPGDTNTVVLWQAQRTIAQGAS